ncbi:unnamed protein product [Dovyalis caffra]|uniref:Uncharacterized protein n=1 Tax=Dovyalis caffra TaxID=77055 RepID=A0AAV1SBJ8_9ROSI|nr:unnamed protein product [Dovyalis caffra]
MVCGLSTRPQDKATAVVGHNPPSSSFKKTLEHLFTQRSQFNELAGETHAINEHHHHHHSLLLSASTTTTTLHHNYPPHVQLPSYTDLHFKKPTRPFNQPLPLPL